LEMANPCDPLTSGAAAAAIAASQKLATTLLDIIRLMSEFPGNAAQPETAGSRRLIT